MTKVAFGTAVVGLFVAACSFPVDEFEAPAGEQSAAGRGGVADAATDDVAQAADSVATAVDSGVGNDSRVGNDSPVGNEEKKGKKEDD